MVNTSKIAISTDNNTRTKVLEGLPSPKTSASLTSYYTYQVSTYNNTVNAYATITTDGDMTIATSKEEPYTSGYGFRIHGAYIIDE